MSIFYYTTGSTSSVIGKYVCVFWLKQKQQQQQQQRPTFLVATAELNEYLKNY